MSTEPSPKANPFDVVFHNVWLRAAYLLVCAAFPAGLWFVIGPGNSHASAGFPAWPYGMFVTWATCAIVPAVPAPALMRHLPGRWFRVPAGERVLHRMAGVGIFGWLLEVSGWNRKVLGPLRGFSGKRAGLLSLEQSVRAAAVSHGICFAIHVLLAILALFSQHSFGWQAWSGALWILLPGVVVHLYPVLVQRSLMLRLQPLLDHPPIGRVEFDSGS